MVLFDSRMSIPATTRAVVQLHESHTAFDKASREEAISAECLCSFFIDAVELQRRVGLL